MPFPTELIPQSGADMLGFGLFCFGLSLLLIALLRSLFRRPQHRERNYQKYSQEQAHRHVAERLPACQRAEAEALAETHRVSKLQ